MSGGLSSSPGHCRGVLPWRTDCIIALEDTNKASLAHEGNEDQVLSPVEWSCVPATDPDIDK